MERVDYVDTFIAVADDCPATSGTAPRADTVNLSVAARTFRMIREHPYEFTSGDVIFTVYADRHSIDRHERAAAREHFYSKGRPCLRASDLGKRYGWGIHADSLGRLALYGVETPEYKAFASGARRSAGGEPITQTRAMRNSRKPG